VEGGKGRHCIQRLPTAFFWLGCPNSKRENERERERERDGEREIAREEKKATERVCARETDFQ